MSIFFFSSKIAQYCDKNTSEHICHSVLETKQLFYSRDCSELTFFFFSFFSPFFSNTLTEIIIYFVYISPLCLPIIIDIRVIVTHTFKHTQQYVMLPVSGIARGFFYYLFFSSLQVTNNNNISNLL